MQEAEDKPYIVYTNVLKMLAYRGLELTGAVLTSAEFGQKINMHEYVIVTATRGDKSVHQFYILNIGAKYCNKSPEFAKLLAAIKEPAGLSVMFISPDSFSNSILGKITEFHLKNPTAYVEHHEYYKFYAEHPKHVMASKHEIAAADEIENYCKIHCAIVADFPRINVKDTQAVWIGARPGDICKIHRISENAGITIVYRLVVGVPY